MFPDRLTVSKPIIFLRIWNSSKNRTINTTSIKTVHTKSNQLKYEIGVWRCSTGDHSRGAQSVGEQSVGELSVGEQSVGEQSVGEQSVGEQSV